MKLNDDTNYIVSGLERSGTSLMMQILEASGILVSYDNYRKSDTSNPNGYYELFGGQVIDLLKEKRFSLDKYKGKFIKITSWGLQYLPKGNYEIIYMVRNIDEIVESTIKMSKFPENYDKEKLKKCLLALDKKTLYWLKKEEEKGNLHFYPIFYNALVNPKTSKEELGVISSRYGSYDIVENGLKVIDVSLYRNRSI